MIGDLFGYGISALTAIAAVVFGIRQSSQSDRTGLAQRLKETIERVDELDAKVQMLQRREIWHERKESILMGALSAAGVPMPEMPPAPEVYDT